MLVLFMFELKDVQAGTPTQSPTSHHNSANGKYFGIACAVFLLCVAMATYVYNMASINAMICCTKAPTPEASKPLHQEGH
jgi:hypothetical protein